VCAAELSDVTMPSATHACILDLCEAEELQHTDVDPSDIELVPLGSKPSRFGIGVVIVV
jgi:hypothetical protein